MADLSVRNARYTIERALQYQLSLAYKVRKPAVANVTALRAVASTAFVQDDIRYVTSSGYCWIWNRFSTSTDDGTSIVKPSDVASASSGRWLITSSTVTSGYIKQVEIYRGQMSSQEAFMRCIGQSPCLFVVWDSAENNEASTMAGVLYRYVPTFSIWALSRNLRDGAEGTFGSLNSTESSADPGTIPMIGDVKLLLAGYDLAVTGVTWTEVLDENKILEDYQQRVCIDAVRVAVHATLQYPDVDSALVDLDRIDVTYKLDPSTQNNGDFDSDNYVLSGLTVPRGGSLTQTVAAGTAYVNGTLVNAASASHTFSANKWTYRDLSSSGAWTFTAVTPPYGIVATCAAGSLRVGMTITDSSSVLLDQIFATGQITFGPTDQDDPNA